jgi:hypothetical protein
MASGVMVAITAVPGRPIRQLGTLIRSIAANPVAASVSVLGAYARTAG